MPDFFKKLKKKTEKNKMTVESRRREENTSEESKRRRLPFLPLQTSYTSFFQKQRGESTERLGEISARDTKKVHVFACICRCVTLFSADEKQHKTRRSKKKRRQVKAPLSRKDRMKKYINNRMLEAKAAIIEL